MLLMIPNVSTAFHRAIFSNQTTFMFILLNPISPSLTSYRYPRIKRRETDQVGEENERKIEIAEFIKCKFKEYNDKFI